MKGIGQDDRYFVMHSRSLNENSFFIYQDGQDVVCIGECEETGKMGVTHGWSHAEARDIADKLLEQGHVLAIANSLPQVFSLMEAFDKVF